AADGFSVLGALVACFSIVIPLLWLLLVAWVLFHIRHRERPPLLGPTFRLAERLRPWAMTEVFVIGAFVAYTRLQDVGQVSVGIGGAAAAAAALLTSLAERPPEPRAGRGAARPPGAATAGRGAGGAAPLSTLWGGAPPPQATQHLADGGLLPGRHGSLRPGQRAAHHVHRPLRASGTEHDRQRDR